MAVDRSTVKKLAGLAKLDLTDSQESIMCKDLGAILDWVDQLSQVNTENLKPLGNVNEAPVPLRVDHPSNSFKPKEATKNAPQSDENYFIVPKVL